MTPAQRDAITPETILDCGHVPTPRANEKDSCGTGYGYDGDTGHTMCYACCADRDRSWMKEHGRITLYLTQRAIVDGGSTVSNWPGSLKFKTGTPRESRHNIARTRYDVWFNGPDGFVWHGVQYGDNTQLCHCRRTRERVKASS